MSIFRYDNEFDKDIILNKLSKINSELEEEYSKSERNEARERELIYAQMIQGLKLNILRPNRTYLF